MNNSSRVTQLVSGRNGVRTPQVHRLDCGFMHSESGSRQGQQAEKQLCFKVTGWRRKQQRVGELCGTEPPAVAWCVVGVV